MYIYIYDDKPALQIVRLFIELRSFWQDGNIAHLEGRFPDRVRGAQIPPLRHVFFFLCFHCAGLEERTVPETFHGIIATKLPHEQLVDLCSGLNFKEIRHIYRKTKKNREREWEVSVERKLCNAVVVTHALAWCLLLVASCFLLTACCLLLLAQCSLLMA